MFSARTFSFNHSDLNIGYFMGYVHSAAIEPQYPGNPIIAFSQAIGYNSTMLKSLALLGSGRVLPVASDAKQTT